MGYSPAESAIAEIPLHVVLKLLHELRNGLDKVSGIFSTFKPPATMNGHRVEV
jgi:hypothetical protein